jgi:hypothetical protein
MENMENLVTEQVTENVEHTTEESPKTYTEAEFNAKLDEVLGKKIARKEAKIRKEYERKYGNLEEVLKAGTGKENVDEIADTFRGFYQQKGITIPAKPSYTAQDIEVLARAEAEDIIRGGYDEVVEEVNRLTDIGVANMTAREKAVFKTLAEHRQSTERAKELTKLGVTEDVFNSKEFKDFSAKFAATVPVKDIYDIYAKTQPKKDIKPMGSMKNSNSADSGVKEFYSPDEARRFTKKDFDNNPALFKAVENSMLKWKK